MIVTLIALFYLLGIAFALEAVMTVRTAQGAIAWAVTLVTFPFIAVPAYLVLGRSKFEGMAEAFAARREEFADLLEEFHAQLAHWKVPQEEGPPWYAAMERVAQQQLTCGNCVDLLINGEATFDSILEGIESAQHYILFQFYMIHDDNLGNRVKQVLLDRAHQGVRIYVLYDEYGSSDLDDDFIEEMRSGGIEMEAFKPNRGRRHFQLNFRNHRKMVVVDGRVAWVGGHNVGDEYLGRVERFSPWRDTHVRLQGPVVMQLQMVILGDWYWATRRFPEVTWSARAAEGSDVKAMIFPFAPTGKLEEASLFFVASLNAARRRLWVSAPYFVPDPAVLKALQLAALRGVDVRVITTGTSDSLPAYLAAFHFMEELSGLGIRFYAYQPGFLHEKVLLVDDELAAVGTPNFDNRSFRLNFEVSAVVVDTAFVRKMETMFEDDFSHAKAIDAEAINERPFWWRVAVRISRLAAPVL